MVRTRLTNDQRTRLRVRTRQVALTPHVRDRIEMVLLSDQGWPAQRIGTHLGYCALTVRKVLHAFLDRGEGAFVVHKPGPPPDTARRQQVAAALDRLLGQERTWTAAQLAAALRDEGITLSTRQVRKYLGRMDGRWRRTVRTLRHQQDPARVETATQTLGALKRGRPRDASRASSWMNAASPPASR
jgi:hypothetical protein